MIRKEGRTKRHKRIDVIITLLLIVVWLSLLLYPTFSDYWNGFGQQDAILAYDESLQRMGAENVQTMHDRATRYNDQLLQAFLGTDPGNMEAYEDVLNVDGRGTMCVIRIPSLHVHVPVRHGTDDGTLQNYIGHMRTTSLPVGGLGSHCVLVGHRGLPSSVLFTDLDELEVGDQFMLETLDETLGYEVDQILTVLPHEVDALAIDPNADLCTLVTCTPYGVNSHRLLVRGHRVELPVDPQTGEEITMVDERIHPVFFVAGFAVLVLVALTLWRRLRRKGKRS